MSATSAVAAEATTSIVTRLSARHHELTADEPTMVGGTDSGPTPVEYLQLALASCAAMTIRMYANRKGWPLERVRVQVHYQSIKPEAASAPSPEKKEVASATIHQFTKEVTLIGSLDQEQRQRLLEIGDRCPVHRALAGPHQFQTVDLADPEHDL